MKSGATLVVDALVEAGVRTVFAITGAGNLALLDEMSRRSEITVHFLHHEQAVVMAAQGYARVSQTFGVAVVTTGGGTSNAMTGVLSAYLDSVPVLVISGNESSFHCESELELRAWGVQGFDSVDAFKNIVKTSERVQRGLCPYVSVSRLVATSLDDRMGPVHLDFPMDLQRSVVCDDECLHNGEVAHRPTETIDVTVIQDLVKDLQFSTRPVFYIGNGCRKPEIQEKLIELLELTCIPFFLSWSALDLFSRNHPGNLGTVGIYGERAANLLLQKSDLVVCLGTRLAIPQVGYDKRDFARSAKRWVVDVDSRELEKFSDLDWNLLNLDVGIVLEQLLQQFAREKQVNSLVQEVWTSEISSVVGTFPRFSDNEIGPRNPSFVHSVDFVRQLCELLQDDAIVVTDVGAGLLSGHYTFNKRGSQRLFTSQGLGEMGFGLPAAIGAYFAAPHRQLVCLNTDGAVMFNLQELQSVVHFQIPMKLVIFNNEGYAMIRVSQSNLFDGREFGSTLASGLSFPSFEKIAEAFGFEYLKISNDSDLAGDLQGALRVDTPMLIEVMMDPKQKYLPRLATSKNRDGSLVSPPIEDLDPKIPFHLLSEVLGEAVHESSKRIER